MGLDTFISTIALMCHPHQVVCLYVRTNVGLLLSIQTFNPLTVQTLFSKCAADKWQCGGKAIDLWQQANIAEKLCAHLPKLAVPGEIHIFL